MTGSIITIKNVKNIIERRNREIHKGSCGRILIAAGSVGMAGAAVLAARGALRSGTGLVQLHVPAEIFPMRRSGKWRGRVRACRPCRTAGLKTTSPAGAAIRGGSRSRTGG